MEGGPGGPEAALRVLRAAVPALLALGAALEATADGVQRPLAQRRGACSRGRRARAGRGG